MNPTNWKKPLPKALQKRVFLIAIFALPFLLPFCKKEKVEAFGFGGDAVSMETTSSGDNIQINFQVNPGFGIQKDGPHEIAVYSLASGHEKAGDVGEKIKLYGKKEGEINPAVFAGIEAKQDPEYFSIVNPLAIERPQGSPVAVRARIYFCSFHDNFCSVQVLDRLIQ